MTWADMALADAPADVSVAEVDVELVDAVLSSVVDDVSEVDVLEAVDVLEEADPPGGGPGGGCGGGI